MAQAIYFEDDENLGLYSHSTQSNQIFIFKKYIY